MEEFLEDRLEILTLGAGKGPGDILPDTISWPNKLICPATALICMPHLLHNSYLLHEETRTLSGEPCPHTRHA